MTERSRGKRKSVSPAPLVALSIRQPWATLVVHGIKTIEIRRWSSRRVGPIYIHAGLNFDTRETAWKLVPRHLREQTEQRGGIVGKAVLAGCKAYESEPAFRLDLKKHFNAPEWFLPPRMHGLLLEEATPVSFRPCKGGLYFFAVDDERD